MKVAPEEPETGGPGGEASLSPLALTAGTPFMLSVHASLLVYIARRLANPRNRGLVFEFSDSTVQVLPPLVSVSWDVLSRSRAKG